MPELRLQLLLLIVATNSPRVFIIGLFSNVNLFLKIPDSFSQNAMIHLDSDAQIFSLAELISQAVDLV